MLDSTGFAFFVRALYPALMANVRVRVCSNVTGEVKLLTKGDNNMIDDRGLYAPVRLFVVDGGWW